MLSDLVSDRNNETNRRRVLLIDDEQSILTTFRIALQTFGYEAVAISDPRQGIKEAMTKPFAAIVIDHYMPTLSGADFITQLRSAGVKTPVLLMSASDRDGIQSSALEFEDVVFEPKPILPTRFRELMKGLLGEVRLRL